MHRSPARGAFPGEDPRAGGLGDQPLGLGNRNALDALIATHSVVVDATDLILWVGIGPHALGRYVGFDLRRELLGQDRPQPPELPEDPIQHSEDFRAYGQAQRALEAAAAMAQQGRLDHAIEEASLAVTLQPLSPDAQLLLADLHQQRAKSLSSSAQKAEQRAEQERAKAAYQRFLTLYPPYKRDVVRAEAAVRAL